MASLPRAVWVAAAAVVAELMLVAGRYGFHRDELYFIEAGRHPAAGYPDSPPLVPLLAAAWHGVVGGNLWAFRLLAALAAGALVLVGGLTSRALTSRAPTSRALTSQAPRDAVHDEIWTAALVALCSAVVATGHLFSTTTFDVLLTATAVLLLLGALADPLALRRWLLLGLVTGVALEVKTLPATVLLACGAGIMVAGPRTALRSRGPWLAAAIALALAAPNLGWQAGHGWPQLAMSRAIAAGSSGTSVERWLVVPLQFELTGPVLAVVAGAGLVALFRSAALRPHRWLAVAYLVLVGIVVLTGGKPYYSLGLVPALLAAGVPPLRRWLSRGAARRRSLLAAALIGVHLVVSTLITLPVLPVAWLARSPIPAVNYDLGETVGWDRLVGQVHAVTAALPAEQRPRTVVLTRNYGEAGALSRAARRGLDLPPVFSGHNGFADWGPPPQTGAPALSQAVVVGRIPAADLARWFQACRTVASLDAGTLAAAGPVLDNEEQGAPIQVCTGLRQPWATLWPQVRRLG